MTAKYNRANGYEADCDVIYGDTDSVMVNFKVLAVSKVLHAQAVQPPCPDCSCLQEGSLHLHMSVRHAAISKTTCSPWQAAV